jgi:hypothetical protein
MAKGFEGSTLGSYRIEEQIGRGGMGIVYRATHLGLDRQVALKLIADDLSEDEGFRERFRREPRIAASIEHPNVIPVFDAGEQDGRLYVAMRLVSGEDLGAVLRREGPMEPARAAWIISQVGDALDAAHETGLVHRDVKPANILLENRDGSEHVYLTDFGITKGGGGGGGLTRTGDWVGTVDYVAPEQIEGRDVDRRTDVYALGAVLYHTLAGEPPYAKDSEVAKIYAHLSKPIPTVGESLEGAPPELDATIQRAMAKDPANRYSTAGELGREAVIAESGEGELSAATRELAVEVAAAAKAREAEERAARQREAEERAAREREERERAEREAREREAEERAARQREAEERAARKREAEERAAREREEAERRQAEEKAAAEREAAERTAASAPAGATRISGEPEPPGATKVPDVTKGPGVTKTPAGATAVGAGATSISTREGGKREGAGPSRAGRGKALLAGAAIGIVALAAAGYLLGSSGDDGDDDTTTSSSSPAAAAPADSSADPAYAQSLNTAFRRLDAQATSKLAALRKAGTNDAQATQLDELAGAYATAATELDKLPPGQGGAGPVTAAVSDALRAQKDAYQQMAAAARAGDEDAYKAAKARVRRAQARLARAVRGYASAGYQVG